MITIEIAKKIHDAWQKSGVRMNGRHIIKPDILRQELANSNIGYYRLREYLMYYLGHENLVEETLQTIYSNYPNKKEISFDLLVFESMKVDEVEILIVNKSDNPIPAAKTALSSGMDACAYITEEECEGREYNLMPGEHRLFHTGLYVQMPAGYEMQVRSRSGLALKHAVVVLNSPGTIDADYRGEIGVILINHSKFCYTVKTGERIAQLVVKRYSKVKFIETDTLDETERGEGGFGHTGKE